MGCFHSIPSSDSASEAPLYPESDHEATDPKTSLHSAAQENTQPGTSQSRETLYIKRKRFEVPVGYTGNLRNDQRTCDDLWKVIVDGRRKSSDPKFQIPCSDFVQRQIFSAPLFCSALCHPPACAAVSDSHSDQLLRTLHPNTSVPALYAHFLQLLQSAQVQIPWSDFVQRHYSVHKGEWFCLLEVVFKLYSVGAQFCP